MCGAISFLATCLFARLLIIICNMLDIARSAVNKRKDTALLPSSPDTKLITFFIDMMMMMTMVMMMLMMMMMMMMMMTMSLLGGFKSVNTAARVSPWDSWALAAQ